ncbi:MAG: hypothetical protein KAH44_00940 [Oricola sp.]|jgi:hypothetical protein|nr:hypothetical protein [Oricola sp.]
MKPIVNASALRAPGGALKLLATARAPREETLRLEPIAGLDSRSLRAAQAYADTQALSRPEGAKTLDLYL